MFESPGNAKQQLNSHLEHGNRYLRLDQQSDPMGPELQLTQTGKVGVGPHSQAFSAKSKAEPKTQ